MPDGDEAVDGPPSSHEVAFSAAAGASANPGDAGAPGHDHPHSTPTAHGDEHEHSTNRDASARGLRFAFWITAGFMGIEAVGGWAANSLALLADAGHMLTDAAALLLSLLAFRFARQPATDFKSYGWLRLEILAAFVNGIALLLIAGGIFWEAWERLHDPPAVRAPLMLGIAAAGLCANLLAARALRAGHAHNLNARAAYLHVLGDLLGSVGAIAAGVVLLATGWRPIDPIVSVLVGALILVSAYRVTRQSIDVLLEAVPAHIDLPELETSIRAEASVESLHDLHVWTLSSGVHLLTVHVVITDGHDHFDAVERLSAMLRDRYGIGHATIQAERTEACHGGGSSFCRT